MRKSSVLWWMGLVALCAALWMLYSNQGPAVAEQDVRVQGTLRQTAVNQYEVNVQITRTKEERDEHGVYPVVSGWGNISFDEESGDQRYVPSSVGANGADTALIQEFLGETNTNENADLIGFTIPGEVGTYNMRFTIRPLDEANVKPIEQPVIFYVHREKGIGKDLSWVAKYPITLVKESAER